MNIAFTTQGQDLDSPMDPRFGRTRFLLLLDDETGNVQATDNSEADEAAHGAGPKTVQKLVELGAQVLVTGNGPGGTAAEALKHTGIEIYVGAGDMSVQEAIDAYKNGELKKFQGV